MTYLSHWTREAHFIAKDRTAIIALSLLLALSSMSTVTGLLTVASQEREIIAMIKADAADRETTQEAVGTYGDAAYYSFYVTWDAPAPLAFAALGQRDTSPYLKRIRMLALEGQIYQGESANPLLAQIGTLDLAFVAAYVLPLILIVLLHDLIAGERTAGRLNLLNAHPATWRSLWVPRIGWRATLAFFAICMPFVLGGLLRNAPPEDIILGVGGLLGVTAFWLAVSVIVALSPWRASTNGAVLVGLWLVLNVLTPAAVQSLWVTQVDGPEGGDVALVQREAVNDAWDLPKSATLDPFTALYPQYAIDDELKPFDWRWYFAFQHLGDVTAQDLSDRYRASIRERDRIAATAGWLSPALAIQRHLQGLARTDVTAQLSFDAAIRRYHTDLRHFYYPLVFGNEAFKREILETYPRFGN